MSCNKKRAVVAYARMITDGEALEGWAARARAQAPGRVALDLEADGLYCYHEKICLIQYADEKGVVIIDPLMISDMRPFTEWLRGEQVWMHGADYDMKLMLQAYGILPELVLDTQVAARLLGHEQYGLAALVEELCGVTLSKKNQKANWGRRPLTPEMREYAKGDVNYMLGIAEQLVRQLRALGRYDWFLESCRYNMRHALLRSQEKETESWRIKGAGRLERRGLAALRELYNWREGEAERIDRPPFHVCRNEELLHWSFRLQMFDAVYPPFTWSEPLRYRFRHAVQRFQLLDEEEYPLQRRRREEPRCSEKALEKWLSRREVLAAELGIEPSVLASRWQLESLAAEDIAAADLMKWQLHLLLHTPARVR